MQVIDDARTFGLSRWEKIRIEAATIAVGLIGYHHSDDKEANHMFREFVDPIESWLLQADADAEARNSGAKKLADEVVARVREAVGDGRRSIIAEAHDPGETATTDVTQFEWLAAHLAKRGFLGAASMSRQDLIRAYYTDVNGGVFPDFNLAGMYSPVVPDDLAVNEDGDVVRWDAGLPGWRPINELPGHRIENGRIMWSPGLWPPMETEG